MLRRRDCRGVALGRAASFETTSDANPNANPEETPDVSNSNQRRAVRRWLAALYAAICVMVTLGGITRLTGSGLSMVDWHPLMDMLPPLDAAAWDAVFVRYQHSPQYQLVNHWMTLDDFKRIFVWEYSHRLWGRLLGFFVAVPFAYFAATRQLNRALTLRLVALFLLGGAQGALGWYMVKSGLVDVPEVSHFRLAAHLALALVLASAVQWTWLDLRAGRFDAALSQRGGVSRQGGVAMQGGVARHSSAPAAHPRVGETVGFLALVGLQIVYGALMAGKRAGAVSATFPDMNGYLVPPGWRSDAALWHDLLYNPIAIHAVHRLLAWATLAAALLLALRWGRAARATGGRIPATAKALALVALAQLALGAATVMSGVQVGIAVAHQAGGVALLAVAIASLHQALRRCSDLDPPVTAGETDDP